MSYISREENADVMIRAIYSCGIDFESTLFFVWRLAASMKNHRTKKSMLHDFKEVVKKVVEIYGHLEKIEPTPKFKTDLHKTVAQVKELLDEFKTCETEAKALLNSWFAEVPSEGNAAKKTAKIKEQLE